MAENNVNEKNESNQGEKKLDFETNIKRLEEIASKLESGDISLDESLKLFEEGIEILKECNTEIDNAEQRVNVLLSEKDGTVREETF